MIVCCHASNHSIVWGKKGRGGEGERDYKHCVLLLIQPHCWRDGGEGEGGGGGGGGRGMEGEGEGGDVNVVFDFLMCSDTSVGFYCFSSCGHQIIFIPCNESSQQPSSTGRSGTIVNLFTWCSLQCLPWR